MNPAQANSTHPQARSDVLGEFLADGSAVLFDPLTSVAHELNPTAALVWDWCDGEHSADQIVAAVEECFGTGGQDCRRDVYYFLAYLEGLGLLARAGEQHP
ncbi:PqqD family protein [Gloeobacter kilaueensis]|uniref:PqqD family protein n=1 Tax=Gloeobacter kilaueensis (strain ATCC BAA-2537 / CCAP 1431/1 / ULC 316 / JS1) TaxID=1183438 RepID=U5QFD6_GLOK1|nr:PqqD family protein [Gloeobacter kilaueensis]AGY57687.1 hypothetical protein GKIL_1441 [Gloeobacter kilaueensis JS1]